MPVLNYYSAMEKCQAGVERALLDTQGILAVGWLADHDRQIIRFGWEAGKPELGTILSGFNLAPEVSGPRG